MRTAFTLAFVVLSSLAFAEVKQRSAPQGLLSSYFGADAVASQPAIAEPASAPAPFSASAAAPMSREQDKGKIECIAEGRRSRGGGPVAWGDAENTCEDAEKSALDNCRRGTSFNCRVTDCWIVGGPYTTSPCR